MEEQAILILNGIGGTPGVIRTPDPLLRRQVLYPAELRAHNAGDRRAAASQIAGQCQQPSKHTLTYVHCAMRLSLCQSSKSWIRKPPGRPGTGTTGRDPISVNLRASASSEAALAAQ